MKTAEEWNSVYSKICFNDPAVHGQLLPNSQNIEFINQVQLDALTTGRIEGVQKAVKTVKNAFRCLSCTCKSEATEAILTAIERGDI